MAGWLYFFGMICFVPMTMSGVGYLAADLLGVSPKLWILFFFIGMALFLVLSVIRIKVTTRVQLIVGIVTVAIIVIDRPGHHRQGRQPRPGAVRVQLQPHQLRRLQRRLLRHHLRRHLLHRVRDRRRLRRGDRQPAPLHPDRGHRGDAVRDRLVPVDHLLDHHRLRGQQRRQDGRRPGRAEDDRDHVRRLLARHAGRDRRHVRRVHRVRRLRDRRGAHPVRDGPRGRAARRVRQDPPEVQDARSTRRSR